MNQEIVPWARFAANPRARHLVAARAKSFPASLLLPLIGLAASQLVAGCAASPPPPPGDPAAPPAESTPSTAAGSPAATDPEPADTGAKSAPPAAKEAREADTSDPDGLPKISPDERKVLDGDCKKFTEAVARSVGRKKLADGETRADQTLAALDKAPKVQGVDVAKCTDLMRRDLQIYAARQSETEAKNNLKLVAVNIGVAYENGKKLCPSAGPTPPTLDAFKAGAVATSPNDWMAPGWACVRFGPSTVPTRWQYELKTDKGGGTWEVVARGYPVAGGPPTELFLAGVIDANGVTPPGSVKRR